MYAFRLEDTALEKQIEIVAKIDTHAQPKHKRTLRFFNLIIYIIYLYFKWSVMQLNTAIDLTTSISISFLSADSVSSKRTQTRDGLKYLL